jgi:hypothetical protein
MLHTIKSVEYLNEYKLKLTFNDKKQKVVDLKKYKNAAPDTVFFPFRDLDFFRSVQLDKRLGTLVWPNGVDLCPDALYSVGIEQAEPKKKTTQHKPGRATKRTKKAVA